MTLHQPLALCRAGGASVRGLAHVRADKPNQDAVLWRLPDARFADAAIALADGHGAAPHFRSDTGARLAVESAAAVLGRYHQPPDYGGADALPALLLADWRRRVADDLARDPAPGDGALPGAALAPYGATLIAASATADELTLVQIGDGDLLLLFADGRVARPLADDAGLIGEQTYSLCLDDAERHFRTASIWRTPGVPWPRAVVVASDGVGKSFADDAGLFAAVAGLVAHARADWTHLMAELPGWLAALSAAGSADDASLALLLLPDPLPMGETTR